MLQSLKTSKVFSMLQRSGMLSIIVKLITSTDKLLMAFYRIKAKLNTAPKGPSPQEKGRVILFGADPDIIRTICLCLEAGFSIEGIYYFAWDGMKGRSFSKSEVEDYLTQHGEDKDHFFKNMTLVDPIPILSDNDVMEAAKKDEDLIFVVGAYGIRERNYFIRSAAFMRHRLNIEGRIYHPIFLADHLDFKINNCSMTGFPGSGNTLAQKILNELKEAASFAKADWRFDAIHNFATNYSHAIASYLEGKFIDLGLYDVLGRKRMDGLEDVALHIKNHAHAVIISHIPIFYLYCYGHATLVTSHENITPKQVESLAKKGVVNFIAIRNPLDVIVSCAGKTHTTGEDGVKERCNPISIIDKPRWFRDMLFAVMAYQKNALVARDHGAHIVYYEKFMDTPHDYIKELCRVLKIKISEAEIETIIAKYPADKPVNPAHAGHFWKPGEGKWVDYIPADYRDLIVESGLLELAAQHGYTLDLNRLTRKQGPHSKFKTEEEKDTVYQKDRLRRFMVRRDLPLAGKDQFEIIGSHYHIQGPKALSERMQQLDKDAFFKCLIEAAGISGNPLPQTSTINPETTDHK